MKYLYKNPGYEIGEPMIIVGVGEIPNGSEFDAPADADSSYWGPNICKLDGSPTKPPDEESSEPTGNIVGAIETNDSFDFDEGVND